MATTGYLILWGTALIGAFLFAWLTHAAQAYLNPYPQKLFDGGRLSDEALNRFINPEYNPLGRYDGGGWWEFHSLRNYALHVVGWVWIVVLTGGLHWDERAEVVAATCARLGGAGLTPVFCG